MKRTIKFIFFAMMAAFAAVSCSEKKTEKPKYLWMCIDANFERFSHKDSICYYLDKAKETGFNQIVVDVDLFNFDADLNINGYTYNLAAYAKAPEAAAAADLLNAFWAFIKYSGLYVA